MIILNPIAPFSDRISISLTLSWKVDFRIFPIKWENQLLQASQFNGKRSIYCNFSQFIGKNSFCRFSRFIGKSDFYRLPNLMGKTSFVNSPSLLGKVTFAGFPGLLGKATFAGFSGLSGKTSFDNSRGLTVNAVDDKEGIFTAAIYFVSFFSKGIAFLCVLCKNIIMDNVFGKRLRALRKEKKLGQVALADALKVGKSVISLWEQGKCEPKLSSLVAMAKFFDVTIDYLAGFENVNCFTK